MTWVLVIGVGWVLLAALVAVVIGRSVRLADARAAKEMADEPNFVVDPATRPGGIPAATILPFPPVSADDAARPKASPVRETPTVPGIPVARPPAPGVRNGRTQSDPVRKTGLA
jgi:hypothetical protein